jgi:hypothetical protein
MIRVCNCADGQTIQNFGGFEKCSKGIGIPLSITFNTEETVGGLVNGLILASETPNQAFFDSKYGNQTIEDRWLRLDGIKQYDAPPVDPNTQEFDDGSSYVLNKNSKEVSFVIVTAEANKMLAKVEASVECRGMVASFGDSYDNWVGQSDGVNFTGRKIQDGSFSASVIERQDSTVSQLVIKFKWDRSALESAVDYITPSAMDGYSIKNDTVDLIDARITYGTSLTTGITFDLNSDIGGAFYRLPLGGLDETNLEAYNITDAQLEAGTISESPIGTYVFTYTTPIATGKDITIRPITNPIQKSYDCKDLTADKFKTSA